MDIFHDHITMMHKSFLVNFLNICNLLFITIILTFKIIDWNISFKKFHQGFNWLIKLKDLHQPILRAYIMRSNDNYWRPNYVLLSLVSCKYSFFSYSNVYSWHYYWLLVSLPRSKVINDYKMLLMACWSTLLLQATSF